MRQSLDHELYSFHKNKSNHLDREKYPNITAHFGMRERQELPLDREPDEEYSNVIA